jgi:ABC-2 type transport system permease protein
MFTRIMRHEWRNLKADRTALVVFLLFALLISYASFAGRMFVRMQESNQVQMRADEAKRLSEVRTDLAKAEAEAAQKGELAKYPGWGARHPLYVGSSRGQRYAAMPPTPLAALAIGQSDIQPSQFKVSAGLRENFMITQDLESPFKLFAGHFDLAFVILYFFPLLILALCFDLVAAEKEQGTLAMLLSNPLRLRQVVAGKILLRAAVIFLAGVGLSVLGFLIFGGRAEGWLQLLLWISAVSAYGMFWFALAIAVNALGRGAATNAIILAACWLALVLIIPAAVNLIATTLYPVPSRTEFITAMRSESQAADLKGSQLLGKYLEDHPELARPAENDPSAATEEPDFAMLRLAKNEAIARALQPVLARFETQLRAQHRFTNRFRFFSPAILLQSALQDISGTGVARYQHFLAQVEEFHRRWLAFFEPRVFEKRTLTAADLEQLPAFHWREESSGEVARRVLWPTLLLFGVAIVIALVGLQRYRHYPIAA